MNQDYVLDIVFFSLSIIIIIILILIVLSYLTEKRALIRNIVKRVNLYSRICSVKVHDLFCNTLIISDFVCCLFNGSFQVTL